MVSLQNFLHNSLLFVWQKTWNVYFKRYNASILNKNVSKRKLTINYPNSDIKTYPYDCNYEVKYIQRSILSFPVLVTISVITNGFIFMPFSLRSYYSFFFSKRISHQGFKWLINSLNYSQRMHYFIFPFHILYLNCLAIFYPPLFKDSLA